MYYNIQLMNTLCPHFHRLTILLVLDRMNFVVGGTWLESACWEVFLLFLVTLDLGVWGSSSSSSSSCSCSWVDFLLLIFLRVFKKITIWLAKTIQVIPLRKVILGSGYCCLSSSRSNTVLSLLTWNMNLNYKFRLTEVRCWLHSGKQRPSFLFRQKKAALGFVLRFLHLNFTNHCYLFF